MPPKINDVVVGSHGHVRKSPKNRVIRGLGLSQNEIEKLLVQMKQNNSTGLLGYSFPFIYHKNEPKMINKCFKGVIIPIESL